jgi:hypothetical protein
MDKKGTKMKFFKYCLFSVLLVYCHLAQAHVGSPAISYQGNAGKYKILVNISPPDVIPGVATAGIFVENYNGEKVYVQTQYYLAGDKGSVDPEIANPVYGAKGWFDYSAWFMMSGAADLKVTVDGAYGRGTVIIPVMAVPTADRKMSWALGIPLILLGLLLFILMVTIIGASVSDGLIKPGVTTPKYNRKRLTSKLIAAFVLLVVLYLAMKWCRNERSTYLTFIYKPIKGNSSVFRYKGQNVLHLWVEPGALKYVHESLNYVVLDHGKLMHLVLVREKTLDAFAHLHPIRQDSLNYLVNLPALPPGRYFAYGDIVSWNGFSETITDTVTIPEKPVEQTAGLNDITIKTSPDDAWLISPPVQNPDKYPGKTVSLCGTAGISFKSADSATIIWEHNANQPVKAKKFYALTFHVLDSKGKSAALQPYMGMAGHALVVKYDGSVYAHLHPAGNFAMASQQVINHRMQNPNTPLIYPNAKKFRDSVDNLVAKLDNMTEADRSAYLMAEMGMGKGMDMNMSSMENSKCGSVVQFPYSFPVPGKYRIWLEVKINGKIVSSEFDTDVTK